MRIEGVNKNKKKGDWKVKREERKSEGREKRILWQGKGRCGSGGGEGKGGGKEGLSHAWCRLALLEVCTTSGGWENVYLTIHFVW